MTIRRYISGPKGDPGPTGPTGPQGGPGADLSTEVAALEDAVAALPATYAPGVQLPLANGTDDTSAIQAVLTASAGKTIYGRPGSAYKISAPLVISSYTTLVMSDCTVTLLASSDCNMLVNAAYAADSGRDSDIRVVGGLWQRNSNTGTNNDLHMLILSHVDRVSISDARFTSSAGKYAVYFADVDKFSAERLDFDTHSDGVHVTGPATNGFIGALTGSTGDDTVGITPSDYATYAIGAPGNITDVVVDGVFSTVPVGIACIKIYSNSTSAVCDRIAFRNVAQLGSNTTNGVSGNRYAVSIAAETQVPTHGLLTFENIDGRWLFNSGTTIETIVARNLSMTCGASDQVLISFKGSTIGSFFIDGMSCTHTAAAYGVYATTGHSGTIDRLVISNCDWVGPGGYPVRIDTSSTTIGTLLISDSVRDGVSGGGGLIRSFTGSTISRIALSNVLLDTTAWIADIGHSSTVTLNNVNEVAAGAFNVRTGTITLDGAGNTLGTITGTVTPKSFGIPMGLDNASTTANAMCVNTDAGKTCGVGPVICNGTSWKHLYTGTTYTP